MKRLLVQVGVLVATAVRGLQASALTSAIAILTIAVALVLVGTFGLIVGNMQGLLQRFGDELHVTAYLDAALTADERRALGSRVSTAEGVESVRLISKEDALDRFQELTGGAGLLEGLEGNPLPTSLEITLLPGRRSPEDLAILVSSIEGLPGIDELAHGQDWVEGYARVAALVRAAAVGIGVVLGLAALLIVANTIRLAVYAREDELEILALVGAGRAFVRIPFLIEGTVQGAIGGLAALGILYLGFRLVLPELEYGLEIFVGNAPPRFFVASEVAALVSGGSLLGMFGSFAAVTGWRA